MPSKDTVCRKLVQAMVQGFGLMSSSACHSHRLGSVLPGHGQREHWQRFNGSVHVEQSRVGVDVRGELGIAVTHRGLSRAERDSRHAQMSPEGCPQSVNVDRPASVVALRDASGFIFQVPRFEETSSAFFWTDTRPNSASGRQRATCSSR